MLSVVILAFNSEKYLAEVLKSCEFADEVVVVDSGSTDRTEQICAGFKNVKFYKEKWRGFSAQKQLGVDLARNRWVFVLDSDEVILPPLREEILRVLDTPEFCAYEVARANVFFGKEVRSMGLFPDYTVRLFDKTRAEFDGREIHEKVVLKSATDNEAAKENGDEFNAKNSLGSETSQGKFENLSASANSQETTNAELSKFDAAKETDECDKAQTRAADDANEIKDAAAQNFGDILASDKPKFNPRTAASQDETQNNTEVKIYAPSESQSNQAAKDAVSQNAEAINLTANKTQKDAKNLAARDESSKAVRKFSNQTSDRNKTEPKPQNAEQSGYQAKFCAIDETQSGERIALKAEFRTQNDAEAINLTANKAQKCANNDAKNQTAQEIFSDAQAKFCAINKAANQAQTAPKNSAQNRQPSDAAKSAPKNEIGRLKNHFKHYAYDTIEQFIAKQNRYSSLGAKSNKFKAILNPAWTFFKLFFLKGGWREGWRGYVIARLYAQYTFWKYVK